MFASDKISSHKELSCNCFFFFIKLAFFIQSKSPKTYKPKRALERATQIRFSIFKNPILLSSFDLTSDINIISFSSP